MRKTLQKVRPSLPASWYCDPDHYQFELEKIWYREWVCVGHVDALQRSGDYFTTTIGDQSIIVTRAKNGAICAWYNTCTHRGSRLCTSLNGRFPHGRIICPYHTWTFSTDGELLATPNRIETNRLYPHLSPAGPSSNPSVAASTSLSNASIISNAVGGRPSFNALNNDAPTEAPSETAEAPKPPSIVTSNAPVLGPSPAPAVLAITSASFPSTSTRGNASSTASASEMNAFVCASSSYST